MEEIDIATVTKRSVRGVFALVSRTLVIQIIGIVSTFLLSIFLDQRIFGVYGVVSAVIAFFVYFSDIGLAAALIQKKDQISDEDLKTTFTIQQVLVILIVILALTLSQWVGKFYELESPGIQLFQALVISFFFSSLKTIPSILLERNLRFDKLVIPQIVENIFYYGIVVILAIKGFGISSFTYAVLARGVSGLITIYIIAPWKVSLGFSIASAKKLLSFGLPFQANSFIALLKDDLLLVYLGKVLPFSQVGYIVFAKKLALSPLRLVMDNVIRITFPSFSRLQHNKNLLGLGVEKSLFAGTFIIFPSLMGIVVLAPYIIHFIPKYMKWEPALFALSLFAIEAGLSSISTPFTNALNAIGKVKITLYLMIFWTISTWILTPLAIVFIGFNGVAITSMVISFSLFIVIYLTKKYIAFSVIKSIIYPLISATIMGIALYALSPMIVKNLLMLIVIIILGGILYLSTIFLLAKNQILSDIKLVRENLSK